ncbi:unnamed protein product [Laminaria digitata]
MGKGKGEANLFVPLNTIRDRHGRVFYAAVVVGMCFFQSVYMGRNVGRSVCLVGGSVGMSSQFGRCIGRLLCLSVGQYVCRSVNMSGGRSVCLVRVSVVMSAGRSVGQPFGIG